MRVVDALNKYMSGQGSRGWETEYMYLTTTRTFLRKLQTQAIINPHTIISIRGLLVSF